MRPETISNVCERHRSGIVLVSVLLAGELQGDGIITLIKEKVL